MKDLSEMSVIELLQTHGAVIDELLRQNVSKTRNNPIGDYTEWLVCNRMKFQMANKNQKGFDAKGQDGKRYQIKGGRKGKGTVPFSPIRNLEQKAFHSVIAVAFNEDYSIRFAAKIPHELVKNLANFNRSVNGYVLRLNEAKIKHDGVTDISGCLQPD